MTVNKAPETLHDRRGRLVAIRGDIVEALAQRCHQLRAECPKCRVARNCDHLCGRHRENPWVKI